MPTFPAYAITHIRLDGPPAPPPLPGPGQGSYVVFWWQEIALGQLFLAPGELLIEAAYHAALLAAITPAVHYYASQHSAGQVAWATWLAALDYKRWTAWMATIMSGWLPAAPPTQLPVSVVICTRGRATQLRRCLHMLHGLACQPTEIVVVDNAPTDTSTRDVCREFAGVVYREEPRAGLDIARNTGIITAQGPIVAFVDDDVVVHPWLIYRVWETFRDPSIAAMTGLVIALELQTEAQLIFEQNWSFNRGYVDKLYSPHYVRQAASPAPPVWEIGAGANMAFRKSVFEEIGYFDELLDVGAAGCSGDSEIWYRILLHGHSIHYNPRAVVYHEHRAEIAGLKHQLFHYMRGHVVAALIQQAQQPRAGYAHHVYRNLPRYYFVLLRISFPFFRSRSRTLWAEIRGLASGISFYRQHRQKIREMVATRSRTTGAPCPLVSVIIPCYNHGRYLLEALTSIWEQDYPGVEIIVIDDGSTDDTREIALCYPTVKYYYQPNQGLSAARNAGIARSTGQYLVFLDADDWLLPQALSFNAEYLQQNPHLAFVSGGHQKVYAATGSVKDERQEVTANHYFHLLWGNYIGMHAAVMYQRWAFDDAQYDPALRSCEDYDVYLRLARTFPVAHHTQLIAAYRLHDTNMSGNTAVMLASVLAVLERQQPLLQTDYEKQAYASGYANWQAYYHPQLNQQGRLWWLDTTAARLFAYPGTIHLQMFNPMLKKLLKNYIPAFGLRLLYKAKLHPGYQPTIGQVAVGDFERLLPFSTEFGYDRGGPIDRYYIENFLQKEAASIRGRALEIGDNSYTMQYGGTAISQSDVLHIDATNPQATFVGDLSDAPQIPDNTFDCLVLTQTLHLIYEFKAALRTCYRILKPGGTLLLTVPGITPIDRGEWKETWYWTFTDRALHRLFAETFTESKVEISSFGNVRVATAYLYGLGLPEIDRASLDYYDPQFQVINAVKAVKYAAVA